MPSRIEYIEMNGFRGASNPIRIEFDKTKPAVLIFGENGTGKSTIVDAIDFVCNECFGSLEERSVPTRKDRYMPTLGTDKSRLSVKLGFNAQEWTTILKTSNRPETKGPASKPNARILKRSQILEIVNGQPKERFNAIKSFIQVPICEGSETALRDAYKTTKKNYDDACKHVST